MGHDDVIVTEFNAAIVCFYDQRLRIFARQDVPIYDTVIIVVRRARFPSFYNRSHSLVNDAPTGVPLLHPTYYALPAIAGVFLHPSVVCARARARL